jgi:hypothetical protein
MFITTTLGGLALAVTVSVTVGTVAGALVRPSIDRACNRIAESYHRVLRRTRRTVRPKSDTVSG